MFLWATDTEHELHLRQHLRWPTIYLKLFPIKESFSNEIIAKKLLIFNELLSWGFVYAHLINYNEKFIFHEFYDILYAFE